MIAPHIRNSERKNYLQNFLDFMSFNKRKKKRKKKKMKILQSDPNRSNHKAIH